VRQIAETGCEAETSNSSPILLNNRLHDLYNMYSLMGAIGVWPLATSA